MFGLLRTIVVLVRGCGALDVVLYTGRWFSKLEWTGETLGRGLAFSSGVYLAAGTFKTSCGASLRLLKEKRFRSDDRLLTSGGGASFSTTGACG